MKYSNLIIKFNNVYISKKFEIISKIPGQHWKLSNCRF